MRKLLDRVTFEHALHVLVLLNLLDAASTHLALKIGIAWEVNPLLRWAYTVSPDLFWVVKMVLVVGGMVLIGRIATEKVARSVILSANALYLLVVSVHVYGWVAYLTTKN